MSAALRAVPTAAASQDFSYHNTDSAEVRTASPHCPLSNVPSAAEGVGLFSGAGTMGGQMLELDINQQGQSQHTIPQRLKTSEHSEPPKQSAKAGWFSGWFNSKPKDVQKESQEQESPVQTVSQELPPTTGFCPPPPPAIVSPGMFPSQPSSVEINPFSRKAGQQLG
ncbi:hypothetical protein D9C73_008215 [Collichthys lucidus]|uniref:Uncharacterized protein n=1 Tax=Collichthys lucidus TaxID=240159 RepID=A0A4U5UHC6_COLLU|nr:hypothetical protein D9C73_008215 [Collichthys lucidus]